MHRGNLFLIGMMGCGKSTLGKVLARHLDKTFVDADTELERKLGVTIPVIFEIEGEAVFREREEAVLQELVQLTNVVLATGGGAVVRSENRRQLKQNGTVLYLHASPQTLFERTGRSRHRPLLNTEDRLARLEELYQCRDPFYRETADMIVESGQEQATRLAQRIEAQFHLLKGR